MSLNVGFDAQTPSLPSGGGAISGLGETFTPDLSTGTGTYTVVLDTPNGPNDIGPRLSLRYDTGTGNGPFGMGFSVPLPRIVRSVAKGYPRYDATDTLMLEGAGEVLSLGGGQYRLQVDGGAWRIEPSGDGFRLTDRVGMHFYLGTDPSSRLSGTDRAGTSLVYAWHLARIEDPLGNEVRFAWRRDQGQLYLDTVAYGAYEIHFRYGSRPDPLRLGRAGFLLTTALRCEAVELFLAGERLSLLRRWTLSYTEAPASGCSLLATVTLSGFDEDGSRIDTPPLQLGYSTFSPRELVRFEPVDEGASPGPLTRNDRRVELVDWNGDGLPDLLEIAPGGRARWWPNAGECRWGRPVTAGDLPLFSAPSASIGFVDLDGNGAADLIRTDVRMTGYVPRTPEGGFERPVLFRRAPPVSASSPEARFIDLDGDGRLDLMTSNGSSLMLHYRDVPDGWSARPEVIPRGEAPVVNLADPHVFLADMTGDGSVDIVRVDGRGVTYWPYLGNGRWGDPVIMREPPVLPFDVEPSRLFLNDIDGDGCADLVYVAEGRVHYWINRTGNGFSEERIIDYVPTGRIGEVRVADMRGSGTAGLLWSTPGSFLGKTEYFYLDFTGGSKPYLLDRIDNGVGLVSRIQYTTSALQAARAAAEGEPWDTSLPVVVPVVERMDVTDAATGQTGTTIYRYRNGCYDGVLREFAGFARVDSDVPGGGGQPALRTTTWFHVGLDPSTSMPPRTLAERRRLRALRGRLLRRERYELDGSPLALAPFDRFEQAWRVDEVDTAAGPVHVPRLATTVESTFERAPTASAIVTRTNVAWDGAGNVTDMIETSTSPLTPSFERTLRTQSAFASDATGRFLSKLWRTRQLDGSGAIVADTILEYDDAPEGTVGVRGLVTRRQALVLTDSLVARVYGAEVPDFAALGYHRRPGEDGYWITIARYERTEDAASVRGRITGPRGAETVIELDPTRIFPVRITAPFGHTVTASYDPRISRPTELTDVSGATRRNDYDALSRLAATIEPGDTEALPTSTYRYTTDRVPVEILQQRRAVSGEVATLDIRQLFDGAGRLIEQRARDGAGEIILESRVYDQEGRLSRLHRERRAAGTAYVAPGLDWPHASFTYDVLGRVRRAEDAGGAVRTFTYGPGVVEHVDAEGRVTVQRIDPTGRVRAVEQRLGARTLASTYEYDVKGNLVRHVDALGRVVETSFDCFGRVIRASRPEQTTVTVLDASGNPVEVRTGDARVHREFDLRDRPVVERFGTAASPPVVRFGYHDPGRTPPPEAGVHTLGRVARIDDAAGTTVLDYDARGNVTQRRWTQAGSAVTHRVDLRYRSDGQVDRIVYPDTGGGRLVLDHRYDVRGLLSSVPTVAAFESDLAGRRTLVRYANGVSERRSYDGGGRLAEIELRGPGGVLWSARYVVDRVGNVLGIESPDPRVAAAYEYDDLHRLIGATQGSGERWTYAYDDAGNLTHKSDVGDYRYGENGAPATCLTSAGASTFTYDSRGNMEATPWGVQVFDALGRLTRLVRPDGLGHVDFRYDYQGHRVIGRSSGAPAGDVELVTPDALYSIEAGVLVLNLGSSARQRAGERVFLHRDHLGSLIRVTSSDGTVIESRRYDPYGAVLEDTDPVDTPIGFIGGVPDAVSGLLYLESRYYHPKLGRFVSPDNLVGDVYDPFAWASYTYCRCNPTSLVDPTGHDFWRIFAVVVAVIALVALTVVTLGAATPVAVAVAIGVVAGGVVGGVTAARAGGDFGDVLAGIIVGMAVGGWGAYLSAYAGAFVASKMGVTGIAGGAVAGGVNGAINGAAMGFAAGFAAKDSLSNTLRLMMESALVGLVAGAAIGAVTGGVTSGEIKKPDQSLAEGLEKEGRQWLDRGAHPPVAGPTPAEAMTSERFLEDAGGKFLGAAGPNLGYAAGKAGELVFVQVLAVDLPSGAWAIFHEDILTYLRRTGTKIEIKGGGSF